MSSSVFTPVTTSRTATKTSTPLKSTAAVPGTESPGNWRHPRLTEIQRRQNATVFSEKNVTVIIYNLAAFAILFALRVLVRRHGPSQLVTGEARTVLSWAYFALQLVPAFNIGVALLPLVRRPDDLSDIPLTPSQRKLLGLPPSSAPPTPGAVYSTPPRIPRTPSIGGSPASILSYGSSPLSGKGDSPASGSARRPSGSPATAVGASPLLQKAITGGMVAVNGGAQRKSSFGGSGSPLGPGGASTVTSLFNGGDASRTPSPSAGKRSSVGLNNKWLYDRGRRASGGNWLY